MTSESTLNILHLSDLHFSKGVSQFDQSVVLSALRRDLSTIADSHSKPDIILFSGDLVQSADDQDIYWHLHDVVLDEIKKISGCNDGSIFLFPGNHDASREVIKHRNADHSLLEAGLRSRDEANEYYLEHSGHELIREKFRHFDELRAFFGASRAAFDDGFCRVEQVPGLSVDLISLNTAATTTAGLSGRRPDRNELVVPEASLVHAMAACRPDAFKILVSHHPFDWLADHSREDAESIVAGKVDLHLFGHVHAARPMDVRTAEGRYVQHQAGALYQGRGRYNGYARLSAALDNKFVRVEVRSYYDKRRAFDTGTDVLSGGVFYSSEVARGFWRERERRVDREALKGWIAAKLLPAAQMAHDEGLTDKPLHEVFVQPPMRRAVAASSKAADALVPDQDETPISFSEIVESRSNFVVYGQQEYGKTTLLKQLALSLMVRALQPDSPADVPILIDLASIRRRHQPILHQLRAEIPPEPDGASLPRMLEEGLVTILVDDVDIADKRRWTLLSNFIEENPRTRFIFSMPLKTANEVPTVFGGDLVARASETRFFEHAFLKPFSRGNMRNLVQRWGLAKEDDEERILNSLVTAMRGMNIPLTAVNGTILLSIYEDRSDFKIVNRTVLIEQFVEFALGKPEVANILRESFDFKNKVFILSELAASMAQDNKYFLPRQAGVDLFRNALNRIGLSQDPEALMQHFCAARILRTDADGQLSFRYRAFLEYFIACKMDTDAKFKAWVLDSSRYLSFLNEIQYYAGMGRSDMELLALISDRYDRLVADVFKESSWSPDLTNLEKFEIPDEKSDKDLLNELQRQMEMPPMTPAERDEALDAEVPHDEFDRQEVFRPTPRDAGTRWTLGLLLYSGVLKNLEIIPDAEKRNHLRRILKGWGEFLATSLMVVPLLARERKIKINGVDYHVLAPRHFNEAKVARMIYLQLPNSIGRIVVSSLGTEKLQRQLAEPTLEDTSGPLVSELYRAILTSSLRLPGWVNMLKTTEERLLRNARYLAEALLQTVSEIHTLGAYDPQVERPLREIIANGIAVLGGGSRKDQLRRHDSAVQQIQRRANLRRLRIKSMPKSD